MASASDLVVSGIKAGDNLRIEAVTFSASQTNADITVLTRSGKGYISSIFFGNQSTSDQLKINSIKITVDGAAERTLSLENLFEDLYNPTGGNSNRRVELNCPIKYSTSITFKVNYTTGTTGTNARALLIHSIG